MPIKDSETQTDQTPEQEEDYTPSTMWNQPSGLGRFSDIMKNPLSWLVLGGIILIVAAFSIFSGDREPDLSPRIAELERQVEYLQTTINTLEKAAPDNTLAQQALDGLPPIKERIDSMEEKLALLTQDMEKRLTEMEKKRLTAVAPPPPKKPAPPRKAETVKAKPVQYHTVQKGDTLYSLSRRYGLTVDRMRRINSLKADEPLKLGQKLRVTP
jgi:hypothetical protein